MKILYYRIKLIINNLKFFSTFKIRGFLIMRFRKVVYLHGLRNIGEIFFFFFFLFYSITRVKHLSWCSRNIYLPWWKFFASFYKDSFQNSYFFFFLMFKNVKTWEIFEKQRNRFEKFTFQFFLIFEYLKYLKLLLFFHFLPNDEFSDRIG